MELKFTGTVTKVLPVKSGTSASGKAWSAQEFVVMENVDQYPQSAGFNVFGDKVKIPNEGDNVTVHFNIRCNLFNDKAFTSLSPWRIEVEQGNAAPAPPIPQPQQSQQAPVNEGDSDLPF